MLADAVRSGEHGREPASNDMRSTVRGRGRSVDQAVRVDPPWEAGRASEPYGIGVSVQLRVSASSLAMTLSWSVA
jgi:hypothetical protein